MFMDDTYTLLLPVPLQPVFVSSFPFLTSIPRSAHPPPEINPSIQDKKALICMIDRYIIIIKSN